MPNGRQARGSRWDRAWPRILAVVQAAVGAFVLLNEALGENDRPYLLTMGAILLFGAPGTAIAGAVLSRWLRGLPGPPPLPPKADE